MAQDNEFRFLKHDANLYMALNDKLGDFLIKQIRTILSYQNLPDPFDQTITEPLFGEITGNSENISPEVKIVMCLSEELLLLPLSSGRFYINTEQLHYNIKNSKAAITPISNPETMVEEHEKMRNEELTRLLQEKEENDSKNTEPTTEADFKSFLPERCKKYADVDTVKHVFQIPKRDQIKSRISELIQKSGSPENFKKYPFRVKLDLTNLSISADSLSFGLELPDQLIQVKLKNLSLETENKMPITFDFLVNLVLDQENKKFYFEVLDAYFEHPSNQGVHLKFDDEVEFPDIQVGFGKTIRRLDPARLKEKLNSFRDRISELLLREVAIQLNQGPGSFISASLEALELPSEILFNGPEMVTLMEFKDITTHPSINSNDPHLVGLAFDLKFGPTIDSLASTQSLEDMSFSPTTALALKKSGLSDATTTVAKRLAIQMANHTETIADLKKTVESNDADIAVSFTEKSVNLLIQQLIKTGLVKKELHKNIALGPNGARALFDQYPYPRVIADIDVKTNFLQKIFSFKKRIFFPVLIQTEWSIDAEKDDEEVFQPFFNGVPIVSDTTDDVLMMGKLGFQSNVNKLPFYIRGLVRGMIKRQLKYVVKNFEVYRQEMDPAPLTFLKGIDTSTLKMISNGHGYLKATLKLPEKTEEPSSETP